ncbi:MAG: damage-inducible protein J [Bilifractor sp.]|nr:damage-inducible protein J [Lachnospiraceae bacterium]MDY2837419.1 damage-inducible protein J [Bilifractor sp.]
MAKTVEMSNFTFKMDKTTREQYSALCNELGLTMSSATLALIKQAVRNQSMSFSLRDENGFTPEEAAELMRRIHEVQNNEVVHHDLMES